MVSRPWKKSESAKCLINHRHILANFSVNRQGYWRKIQENMCVWDEKKMNFNSFFPSKFAMGKPSYYCFSFHSTLLFSLWVFRDFFWNLTPLFHFMKWFLTILFDDVIKPNWFILLFKSIILLCTWKCNFLVLLLYY